MKPTLFLLLLCACGEVPQASEELTIDALSRVDVRGTATSVSMILDHVHTMPDETRREAVESLRVLTDTCPYTRAAMQLPFDLHAAVGSVDAERLDPLVQQNWVTLRRGLATHVEVLRTLGVQPSAKDARSHIDAIVPLAKGVDPATSELIDVHSERMELLTGVTRLCPRGPWSILPGHPWTLGMQLSGWHDALRRIQPFAAEPEAAAAVESMLALFEDYNEATFASVAVTAAP